VIAAPGQRPRINPTGNALLATAGTGDVLAGMIGAALAGGLDPWSAARTAVHRHGALADAWARRQPHTPLCASDLLAAD
jgi:NAD(P)H-hydrate repair Nnr-like enzyme with NAD(P)H-hydrate dehydratase domain